MGKAKKVKDKPTAATSKQYNPYLDVLKGFAILLVVLGHSVQSFAANGSYDNNWVFRVVYSFHMPLFMFLSGAAAAYSFRPMNFEFIKRKFYQLVVPFVAWYLLGYLLQGAYHNTTLPSYIHKVVVSPDYGLWFLWALFLNFCCLAAIKRLTKYMHLYAYPLVWLAIYAIPTGKYGIGLVKWHLPFFATGYLIFLYRNKLARYRAAALTMSSIGFPLLVASWHRLYSPSFVTDLSGHLAARHLLLLRLGDIAAVNTYQIFVLFYNYLVPFCGIGFVYWLIKLWPNKYIYRFLGLLGLYTLDVYVSHEYFFRFAIGKSWLEIISSFILGLSLSVALGVLVLRQVPLLSTLFLGGRAKPFILQKKAKK